MSKKSKEYTLTFFVEKNGDKEILEEVSCDWWNFVGDDSLQIIYCLNEDRDNCVGYPASSLRRIKHNRGVLKLMNEEHYTEEKPEGYS